ncbi:MAG: hypothetical protein JWM27_2186 [Gemmatimonadetes bacterium]|nr:hypothetical protein [Gemmatimonadota bacterium]
MTATSRKPLPGWTWVFAAQKTFIALTWCRFAAVSLHHAWAAPEASGRGAITRAFAGTRAFILVGFAVLIAGGLLRILRRDPGTRCFWLAALPAITGAVASIALMDVLEMHAVWRAGIPEMDTTAALVESVAANVAMNAAWWLYWLRSRGVRLTFEPDTGWEAVYRHGIEERAREADAAKAMAASLT